MQTAIKNLGVDRVRQLVGEYSQTLQIPDELHIMYVCDACCANQDDAPTLRLKKDATLEDRVKRWVEKFKNGYDNRISRRVSKMPGTKPDGAVSKIIQCAMPNLDEGDVKRIVDSHRLAMNAENILGSLLEEFLFNKLKDRGWACAWGETVLHVDFCSESGLLLQIKNRSNSENSSSSKVRVGTPITKWHRIDAVSGNTKWANLCADLKLQPGTLTEQLFFEHINGVLLGNRRALAIEADNVWNALQIQS